LRGRQREDVFRSGAARKKTEAAKDAAPERGKLLDFLGGYSLVSRASTHAGARWVVEEWAERSSQCGPWHGRKLPTHSFGSKHTLPEFFKKIAHLQIEIGKRGSILKICGNNTPVTLQSAVRV
jgi:hypothetical protein